MSGRLREGRFWNRKSYDADIEAFAADCDRILYSSAFRRLNGVTQVVSSSETELFHNRLTHSYKVAQVGVRICNTIESMRQHDTQIHRIVQRHGGLDSRVVQAACFAHDLGHPPFGHVAEHELNDILNPPPGKKDPGIDPDYHIPDGFDGNAQSFRIVTKLAFREKNAVALDLTRATLCALLKYPWLRHEDLGDIDNVLRKKRAGKWGAYDSERMLLNFARGARLDAREPRNLDRREVNFHGRPATEFRTIEAQIMDWADDITYAVHDIEDFFRAGLIPLDQLKEDHGGFNAFLEAVWENIAELVDVNLITQKQAQGWMYVLRKNRFPETGYAGRRSDREGLHTFAAELIRSATTKIEITRNGLLCPAQEQFTVIEILKKMTRYYVIQRPGVSSAQRGQALLIRRLFKGLLYWAEDSGAVAIMENMTPDGPGGKNISGTSFSNDRLDRIAVALGEFPARFVDYLVVAFDPDERIGCTEYFDPTTRKWVTYTAKQRLSRAIVDYIVSLTELQTVALDARLSGFPAKTTLEKWVSI